MGDNLIPLNPDPVPYLTENPRSSSKQQAHQGPVCGKQVLAPIKSKAKQECLKQLPVFKEEEIERDDRIRNARKQINRGVLLGSHGRTYRDMYSQRHPGKSIPPPLGLNRSESSQEPRSSQYAVASGTLKLKSSLRQPEAKAESSPCKCVSFGDTHMAIYSSSQAPCIQIPSLPAPEGWTPRSTAASHSRQVQPVLKRRTRYKHPFLT